MYEDSERCSVQVIITRRAKRQNHVLIETYNSDPSTHQFEHQLVY